MKLSRGPSIRHSREPAVLVGRASVWTALLEHRFSEESNGRASEAWCANLKAAMNRSHSRRWRGESDATETAMPGVPGRLSDGELICRPDAGSTLESALVGAWEYTAGSSLTALDEVVEIAADGLAVHAETRRRDRRCSASSVSPQALEQFVLAGQPLGDSRSRSLSSINSAAPTNARPHGLGQTAFGQRRLDRAFQLRDVHRFSIT